jgi:LacI family transcriptional regulator
MATGDTRPRPPTVRDVAAYAKVSPMTVSRTLRDDTTVSEDMRNRVLEAVDALGYRRNEAARNLRLGRATSLIGVVITNLANPFYAQFALGVESVTGADGLRMVLTSTGESIEKERELVAELVSRRVSGMIVVPAGSDQTHLSADLTGGVPVVLGARPPTELPLDCVLVDDFGGAREATRRLAAAGHRRIGFLGLPPAVWTGSERFRGFCVALDEAGIALDQDCVRLQRSDITAAEQSASQLLSLPDPPTALFCANSRNTLGAFRAMKKLGVRTQLAGFDDFELADVLGVELIVVAYDPQELGRQAARLLLDRMAGQEPVAQPRRVVVPTSVVRYEAH